MTTTVAEKSKVAAVAIELTVKVTKQAREGMTAHDFKREIDEALEITKGVMNVAQCDGATTVVEGALTIGKQKFEL